MVKKKTHPFMEPIFQEFKLRDILQVIVGATILAVPIGFTEETWRLGEALPLANIMGLLAMSIIFISLFTFYHYHNKFPRRHWDQFVKRVFFTYFFSFAAVAIIMILIQQAPLYENTALALKRIVIVTFPSSMSAAVADTIK